MSQRKLQQEMDRVFKKINEGLEIFNTLYDRHQQSSNASQKDKLENDLKKEIKKLQRFREQVKNWQATNEVKDKDKLNDHRRLVETAMEQYKVVEKGSKTKAYSDESLAQSHLTNFSNPEDEEKYGVLSFVQHALDEIQRFKEMTESELDKLSSGAKKGKRGNSYANEEKKSELEEMLKIHKFHQEKLEIILRLVENDILSPDEVMKIQDDVKYYLEENQNPDFIDDDTIYDELNLDTDESVILELQNSMSQVANQPNTEEETNGSSTPANNTATSIPSQNTPQKSKIATKERSQSPSISNDLHSSSSSSAAGGLPPISSITGGSLTTLKPSVAPVKPAGELKWSVAAAASITNSNGSSSPVVATTAAAIATIGTPTKNDIATLAQESQKQQQVAAPPGIPSPVNDKLANINAVNAASVLEALKKQKPQDEAEESGSTSTEVQESKKEPQAAQVDSNGVTSSVSQAIENQDISKEIANLDNDKDFRFLPPGIQSTILSFVSSRNRSLTPENTAIQLSNISTMLSTPRYFSPLSSDIVPPGLEAQRISTIWNSIRTSTNLEIDAQNLDSSTLFYAYYFGLSKFERSIAESILISRRWKLNNVNKSIWLQRHSQVKHSAEDFEIADFNIFDARNWSIIEKKNFKVELSQIN